MHRPIVAISGSSGFLGSNLISLLPSDQYEIILIDISNNIDLADINAIKTIPHFNVMVHLANLTYVPLSYLEPQLFYRTNYLTTLNALELCRKYEARMIYVSSYLYGQPKYLPIDEKHPLQPFNPYAQSKYICENLCSGYYRDFGIETTILRPFNIYGYNQKGKMLIPEILEQIKRGAKTVKIKDPYPKRDYVNVIDVATAIKFAIDYSRDYNCYNICSGKSYSVKRITEIINQILDSPVVFEFGKSDRPNEVNETIGTYKKIKEELGWTPQISFKDGIEEMI